MEYDTGNYGYKYKANLHFHSLLSDGAYTLKELLKIINSSEFDIISLTDHNEIQNSLTLYDTMKDKIVILGIEISTADLIEISVYFRDKNQFLEFFEKYVKSKKKYFWNAYVKIDIFELLKEVKKYNTLLGIPHPFGRKGLINGLYKRGFSTSEILNVLQNFDFYEVINSTKSEKNNAKAMNWYKTNRSNIFPTASSDFHNIRNSFNLAGTNIYSKYRLDLNNFFFLIKSKNYDNIIFSPYGKSLGKIQICFHHLGSVINFFRGEMNYGKRNKSEHST